MYYEDGKVRGRKWVTDKRCDEYLDGLVEFRQSFGDEQASRQWFVMPGADAHRLIVEQAFSRNVGRIDPDAFWENVARYVHLTPGMLFDPGFVRGFCESAVEAYDAARAEERV